MIPIKMRILSLSPLPLNIVVLNPLLHSAAFLHHQKKSENQLHSDILSKVKTVTLGSNGLT